MQVKWKPVPGFPYYSVSNTGLVRSENRVITMKNGRQRTVHQKTLRQSCAGAGYLVAHLGDNKQYVHRLVALAFLGEPLPGYEVNHKDENKKNNCVENLEWVTRTENLQYGTRNERCIAHNLKRSRPVIAIKDGKAVAKFASIHEAERKGFNRYRIVVCCRNPASTHSGYHWAYA